MLITSQGATLRPGALVRLKVGGYYSGRRVVRRIFPGQAVLGHLNDSGRVQYLLAPLKKEFEGLYDIAFAEDVEPMEK